MMNKVLFCLVMIFTFSFFGSVLNDILKSKPPEKKPKLKLKKVYCLLYIYIILTTGIFSLLNILHAITSYYLFFILLIEYSMIVRYSAVTLSFLPFYLIFYAPVYFLSPYLDKLILSVSNIEEDLEEPEEKE